MNRRTFIATMGASMGTMTLAGCADEASDTSSGSSGTENNNGDTSDGSSSKTTNESKPKVEILSHETYSGEYGSSGVKGTVINNSDSEIASVEISVKFFDSEGTRIGEGVDYASDLGAGKKYDFKAEFLKTEKEFDDYEIEASGSSF